MSKLSKILLWVWGILAIISFVSAFWAPLYFKITGLVFGGLNMMIILSLIITYLQGLYYNRKYLNRFEDELQLQKGETQSEEEGTATR